MALSACSSGFSTLQTQCGAEQGCKSCHLPWGCCVPPQASPVLILLGLAAQGVWGWAPARRFCRVPKSIHPKSAPEVRDVGNICMPCPCTLCSHFLMSRSSL